MKVSETVCVPQGFKMLLSGRVTGRWESLGPTGRVEELVSFHRDSNLIFAKALESPVAQVGKAMNLDWRWKGEVGCEEEGGCEYPWQVGIQWGESEMEEGRCGEGTAYGGHAVD